MKSQSEKQSVLDLLESEVKELADESTAELLPMLMEHFVNKHGLTPCLRHRMLFDRVRAEIHYTKAKRWFFSDSLPEERFKAIEAKTLAIRTEYRSIPCTCWVTKR